ncbi:MULTISPECIES: hypothetical protein [unclassified Xanthobacter]|uniref:hypothetical protein n=1 Tax=unclassified Xanthobacter TaxID=2623496 RepID=UPI001F19EE88|nr:MULTISPECIES: hypothetical protein [unclassified Xanthobacter]
MPNTSADHMIEQVAKAMRAKRRELIARPIADIWSELATTAIEALRDSPSVDQMREDRAHEIVAAINSWAAVTLGLDVSMGGLEGVSLAEMLEAKEIVETRNRRAADAAEASGGSYSISVVPDDRLVAAAYCLDHYPTGNEAILCVPRPSFNGTHAALGLVAITPDDENDDEA